MSSKEAVKGDDDENGDTGDARASICDVMDCGDISSGVMAKGEPDLALLLSSLCSASFEERKLSESLFLGARYLCGGSLSSSPRAPVPPGSSAASSPSLPRASKARGEGERDVGDIGPGDRCPGGMGEREDREEVHEMSSASSCNTDSFRVILAA